jgi:hypothetical protein
MWRKMNAMKQSRRHNYKNHKEEDMILQLW